MSEIASKRPSDHAVGAAPGRNPTVAWAKVSRVTVARRRLRVSVLAELPSNPGMARAVARRTDGSTGRLGGWGLQVDCLPPYFSRKNRVRGLPIN